MNKMIKSLVALSIASACSISVVHAATYEIIDNGEVNTHEYTYAHSSNTNGESVLSASQKYNFPVQFQYLNEEDFEAIRILSVTDNKFHPDLEEIEDTANLLAGTPSGNDLGWVVKYLERVSNTNAGNKYQKLGDFTSFYQNNGENKELFVFDKVFGGTDSLTRSTIDLVSGVTDEGWIYGSGSAPYLPNEYVIPEDVLTLDGNTTIYSQDDTVLRWLREFSSRGFISIDQGESIIEILPPTETDLPEEQRFGGTSTVLDMSETRIAVGHASTSIDQDAIDFIFSTPDVDATEDELNNFEGCQGERYLAVNALDFELCAKIAAESSYNTQAMKWELDEQGVRDAKVLGQLVTPHPDDTSDFPNFAQAVNRHGVAVGHAVGWRDKSETAPTARESRSFYAVVYKDDEVISFTPDHRTHFESRAFDINDNGIAVGHTTVSIGFTNTTKFYYVDTNVSASEMEFVLPTDYFRRSSSKARAINNNDLVVGEGEIEFHSTSLGPRRTHGFLYDINADTFTDLNDFLSCDSSYTIIQATGINDLNVISATALVKVPMRNAKGELILDENGNQQEEEVLRAVTLKPIEGEIDSCEEQNEEERIERQGASLGWGVLGLLLSFGFRMRKRQ